MFDHFVRAFPTLHVSLGIFTTFLFYSYLLCYMASSGSSPDSHRAHRRREPGRSSRSCDEPDYSADDVDNNALPSMNPPPGASGPPVSDPPQPPPNTVTGDTPTHATTSNHTPPRPPLTPRPPRSHFPSLSCPIPLPRPHASTPPQFPPSPPTHLTSTHFPLPRLQAPRPRPPPSHPRTTGPPPTSPYAPRPRPRQPLSQPPSSGTIALPGRHVHPSHDILTGDAPTTEAALLIPGNHVPPDAVPQRRPVHSAAPARTTVADRILEHLGITKLEPALVGRCQTPDLGTIATPHLATYTLHRSDIGPPIVHQHVHDRATPGHQHVPIAAATIVPLTDPVNIQLHFFGTSDHPLRSCHLRCTRSGPGDRPHSQPTPPDSTTPISRPTTPPQAFQQPPPTAPPPHTSTLPTAEAEELRQLRLQFQQQAAHQLQHQALLQSSFGPFYPPFPLFIFHNPHHPLWPSQ